MACTNPGATCCLCAVNYPYRRIAASSDVRASRSRSCTLGGTAPATDQTLLFEAKMDLVSFHEFVNDVPPAARFGTYLARPTSGHFCVDKGRRTVDGRRLAWLWMFQDGTPRPTNRMLTDPPVLIWTKADLTTAYGAANDETLPMFTRHVEIYPELAITFCLPLP